MATKEILRTEPLRGLSWSGNDKKTADVPAGDDFVFNVDNLPEFSETWPTPGDFAIVYRDEFNTMQTLPCNYVSNGATRYTFSHKIDNDVINLSVFKSDGHLEINVRNEKLAIPMNLDLVEFDVFYEDGQPVEINIDYSKDGYGRIFGPTTAIAGEEIIFEVIPAPGGTHIEEMGVTDYEEEYPYEAIDTTHYKFIAPEKDVTAWVNFVVNNSFPIEIFPQLGEGTPTVTPSIIVPGSTTISINPNPNQGYEVDYIEVYNWNEESVYYTGTDLNVLIESDWSPMPDSSPDEINWGYKVYVYYKEAPVTDYTLRVVNGEPAQIVVPPGTNVDIYAHPASEGKQFDKWVVSGTEEEVVANIYARETMVNVLVDGIVVTATYKDIPEPPVPTEGDLIFTTTFNRYAIVDVLVKEDGSAGVVNVRRMTETDVDLDDTYETVLRASCTFRQDLIVSVEVIMNKPDNVAANYTVNSTRILINGEEL